MKSFIIDESKYSLEIRLIETKASGNIVRLLENFNNGVAQLADNLNLSLFARTHICGLTYFVTERKGFIFLNIHRDYLTLKFYTGRSSIDGLQKRNWMAGGDNTGSEAFRVIDASTLKNLCRIEQTSPAAGGLRR